MVNREMLSLYYGIGRYISANSREGFWGTSAIKTISEQLRKELPGLKGFSETSLKNMGQFYEQWAPVISNSTATAVNMLSDDEAYAIQDYAKPMGVATYGLSEDMPERLREVLPDVEELKKLL